ncbi:MAG: aminotransferase class V-fold PLP-dependent enzyme [Thermoproteota archaeon]
MLDPQRIREDFPGIVGDYVFMNNADSTGIPVPVLEKVLVYFNEVKSKPGLENTFSHRAMEICEEARETLFKHLGAGENNFIFTLSNLQSLTLAIQSINLKKGETIIASTSLNESSISIIRDYADRNGLRMEMFDFEEDYESRLNEIDKRKDIKAAVLSHVSGVTGAILPVEKIIPVLKDRKMLTIMDATYSVQRMSLNPSKIDLDYLFFKSRNMFSLEGLSILYVSDDSLGRIRKLPEYQLVKRGEDEKNICIVALAAAIKYLNEIGFEDILKHERSLADEICSILNGKDVSIYHSKSEELRTGIFSLLANRIPSSLLQTILEDQFHIVLESGSFGNQAILQKTGGREVLRVSPTIFNTVEEAKRVGERVSQVVEACKETPKETPVKEEVEEKTI